MPDRHSSEVWQVDPGLYRQEAVDLALRAEAGAEGGHVYGLKVGGIRVSQAAHLLFEIFEIIVSFLLNTLRSL